MNETNRKKACILITVSGPDHPGITAALTHILADHQTPLLDMEQVVVRGRLSLSILIEGDQAHSSGTLKDLLFAAKAHGNDLDFRIIDETTHTVRRRQFVLTLLGQEKLAARAIAQVAETLAAHSINIEKIQRLSEGRFETLEMTIGMPSPISISEVYAELLTQASSLEVDLALQPEGFFRRAKRLVVFDLDSTLIQGEMLDLIAETLGIKERIAAITQRAMNGEIEFGDSFRQRIQLLKGARLDDLETLGRQAPLTPGASRLITALHRLGFQTAIISGGLLPVAERVAERLGLQRVYANNVSIQDGKLTGEIIEPIIDAEGKARIVADLARQCGITLDQVVAVGDGANDLPMLEIAGLGIAFHAQTHVQQQARHVLNRSRLDSILFLLGIRQSELEAIAPKEDDPTV